MTFESIRRQAWIGLLAAAVLGACAEVKDPSAGGTGVYDGSWQNLEPIANSNTDAPAQPPRKHPYAIAMTRDGRTALVALRGSEVLPVGEIAVLDVQQKRVVGRLGVGDRPVAVGIRPGDDFAIVLSHLSPYAAVIELSTLTVTGRLRLGHYAENLAFSRRGGRMFVTNRMSDELEEWALEPSGRSLTATRVRSAPAGRNPGALAVVESANKIYVADAGGLGIRVFDLDTLEERDFIPFNAPIADVELMGDWVVVTTLNETNGLPCMEDGDYPGVEGDGVFEHITDRTCSRGFADLQNEIAFIDTEHDLIAIRYTSDTAEISEADREGDHDPGLMRVVGALPHSIAVVGPDLAYVTMGASHELSEMRVTPMGPLTPPEMEMPRTFRTGFAPRGVAVDATGQWVVAANTLGETVTIVDTESGERTDVDVGLTSPAFPATSAELGEYFFSTAQYASDGDMSCMHCHPDVDTDGKAWGVGVVRAYGRRATMVTKNLHETQPLLIEGVFEPGDFTLEMEALSFRPDYHDSSYALQVQRRDEEYRRVSQELLGRDIGFDDLAAHIADYLVVEPRLLPSPFPDDTPEAERGRALFFRPDVACSNCHTPPTFASTENFSGVTTLGRFDLPLRSLDPDVSVKFIEQARDGFFNANTLRGLWDRRGNLFHDGRARTIRETILTPGHACLQAGERPFNEFNGLVDTNGGVSHLTCEQIDDLVAFLKTIS